MPIRPTRNRRKILNRDDRRLIRVRSRQDVEKTLAGLKPFLARARWIGSGNRYADDTIAKISSDAKLRAIRNPRHLSQYIAASCLLHSVDGWSYLGKAILSLLRGDPHRARHLAYYAELRAAMSLLASEGIGIFESKHFVIDALNSVRRLQAAARTHQFAWACLEYWASRPESGALFARIIRPYGRKLDDWFVPLGGVQTIAPQASSWFRQWGVDLKSFPEDRDARNVSSYRPDGIPKFWRVNAHEALNFVRELWLALEPTSTSRFEAIDRQILRLAIEGAFKGRTGNDAASRPSEFSALVSQVLDHQDFSTSIRDEWLKFICRQVAPTNLNVFHHAPISPNGINQSEFAIVSRAALLLRVAAGSTSLLFGESAFTIQGLKFWWRDLGVGRGLWDDDFSDEFIDLWADVGTALEDVASFQREFQPSEQSFFRISTELGRPIVSMAGCERVALWSLSI